MGWSFSLAPEAAAFGGSVVDAAVFIPARRASSRLPDKLLLTGTGTPVIVHTQANVRPKLSAPRGSLCVAMTRQSPTQ